MFEEEEMRQRIGHKIFWNHPISLSKQTVGEFQLSFERLVMDEAWFFQYFMSFEKFNELLEHIQMYNYKT